VNEFESMVCKSGWFKEFNTLHSFFLGFIPNDDNPEWQHNNPLPLPVKIY